MQHPQQDAAQASPAPTETDPANLLWAIFGMAMNINRQHMEQAELKTALQEILQALHCVAIAALPPTPALASSVLLPTSSAPQTSLPEVYHGKPETLQGIITILSLYFLQYPASHRKKIGRKGLGGKALQWAVAIWVKQGEDMQSYELFLA